MKEILFKGKCLQCGEWIEGDLIHGVGDKVGYLYILPRTKNLAYVKHCHPLDGVRIDPETKSQFIGKYLQKNDKIFEGTIAFNEQEIDEGDIRTYLICVFIEEWSMYAWLTPEEKLLYDCGGVKNIEPMDYWTYPIEQSEKYHYAGNIFDNKELLSL